MIDPQESVMELNEPARGSGATVTRRSGDVMSDQHVGLDEIAEIAEEAYIFFFPLQMGYRFAFGSFLAPSLPSFRCPLNVISGEPVTLDHTFKEVITPNADTPYSLAGLDLRAEPIVLSVPRVTDRYYVMQFEDLFGTNPYYVGTRSTGSEPGTYLLAGPRWDGEAPHGIDAVLRFETDLVFLLGRTQLFSADDIEALGRVMAGYNLRPLSSYVDAPAPEGQDYDWPVWDDEASRDERFIGYADALLPLCQPTHPDDAQLMERFRRIGIEPGRPFDASAIDEDVRAAIRAGVDRARAKMAAALDTIGEKTNGWQTSDVFGDREWYEGNHLLRAVGAMGGWGGNDKIEAYYPTAREDARGEPLDGRKRYTLRFDTLPPTRAFWSVTMYDTSYDGVAGYLVENPINRYLINSTTTGLATGEDGSLTISIQHAAPDDASSSANWLPAPKGPFYLVLRIYWPEEAAIDGTWAPPPIVPVEASS